MSDDVLRWPAGFPPECADVWARSELAVDAPPAVVFSQLSGACRWEKAFPFIRNVRVAAPSRGHLEAGSAFDFEIDGLRLSAQVSEFAADSRLAWSGQGIDISAYHVWIVSRKFGGSHVLSGFAARGAAAIALREPDPGAAQQILDRWVAALKTAAESAWPSGAVGRA